MFYNQGYCKRDHEDFYNWIKDQIFKGARCVKDSEEILKSISSESSFGDRLLRQGLREHTGRTFHFPKASYQKNILSEKASLGRPWNATKVTALLCKSTCLLQIGRRKEGKGKVFCQRKMLENSPSLANGHYERFASVLILIFAALLDTDNTLNF